MLLQEVIDESDGCGAKFSVTIVSSAFEGKSLIHRHRYYIFKVLRNLNNMLLFKYYIKINISGQYIQY